MSRAMAPAVRRRATERIELLARREVGRIGGHWLAAFPIGRYLGWFEREETAGNYASFPGELAAWFESIGREAGDEILSAYHRLATATLMKRALDRLGREPPGLAPSARGAVEAWILGLIERLEADPDLALSAARDPFKKDLAICALRMIPTGGPCHFEFGGISRRFLTDGGPRQLLPALRAYLVDLRADSRHLCLLHLDDRVAFRTFTQAGWLQTYRDVAEQMKVDRGVNALGGTAWFWDPRVKEICPGMAYLHDVPRAAGARFFRLRTDPSLVRSALDHAKRRRAYEAGTYRPANVLMIWPRAALLRFASAL